MKKNITILILLCILGQASAQSNEELKNLVRQSFSYNPRIKELEKINETGDIRTEIARSGYLPSLSGTASYSYVNPVGKASFPVGPSETKTIQFQPYNNYNAAINVSQVIFDFGKTQAQIEKAKADLQVNRFNVESARLQLAAQVANVYFGLIYLKQAMVVQDSVIAFYERNKKIVEGKIRQGDALQIDLSNNENSIEQERSRKIEFERQYQRQLALMVYTTGASAEPTSSSFEFAVATPSLAPEQSNPDLQAANERLLSSQSDVKIAQRNQLPTLNFTAGAGFRNGYQPNIEPLRFNYLAGATLNVPIFQGRRLRQTVLLSQRISEATDQSKANLMASIKRDLDMTTADVKAYTEQIHHAEVQIATANEALRLSKVRYERGVITYVDLVFASTNLQRALLNKLQFEYQRCLSTVEQSRLQGVKFWE